MYNNANKYTVSCLPNSDFSPKKYNLRRRFEVVHPNLAELDANENGFKRESLRNILLNEQNVFKLWGNESVTAIKVSFGISKEVAGVVGRSFTEGELIKKFMLSAVPSICVRGIKKF